MVYDCRRLCLRLLFGARQLCLCRCKLGCGRATFLVFRIIALFAVLTGSITSLPIVWAFADIAMGVMTLLNVTAILLLSQWAIAVPADYERSLAEGRKPVFVASTTPGLPTVSRDIVW